VAGSDSGTAQAGRNRRPSVPPCSTSCSNPAEKDSLNDHAPRLFSWRFEQKSIVSAISGRDISEFGTVKPRVQIPGPRPNPTPVLSEQATIPPLRVYLEAVTGSDLLSDRAGSNLERHRPGWRLRSEQLSAAEDDPRRRARQHLLAVLVRAPDVELNVGAVAAVLTFAAGSRTGSHRR
jgi:hypothetical protein